LGWQQWSAWASRLSPLVHVSRDLGRFSAILAAYVSIGTLNVPRRSLSSCWLGCILLALAAVASPLTAAADEEVVIQLKWLHQFQFAGFYAALEQGYFAEEGLTVTLRERATERNIIQQVLSGEAQYGVSDSVLFLHHANHEPVVIVAAIMQHSANAIMTMADSGLTTPRDLVGRRLAFYENDSDGVDILALLADQGILREGLIRTGWDERVSQLISGDVDAISIYVTNEPFVFREMGHEVNVIHPRHYGLSLYGDMLFTSQQEASAHPERVAAMRRAVLRGWRYALDHKAEMVELIYQRYNTQGKSRAALMNEARGMETLIDRHTSELGSLDRGRIDYILTRLQSLQLLNTGGGDAAGLVFESARNTGLELSDAERAFLDSLGTVRFGVESVGWPPFEFFDAEQNFRGIASDYLEILAETLDIEFELVEGLSWEEILEAARAREIDLLPAAASTPNRREYLSFTSPYVRSPMIIVTRDDVDYISNFNQLEGRVIGVVGGYASDELLSRYYPGLSLERYDSALAGLKDLAGGELYAFIDNLAAVSHIIKAEGLANLKISGQTPYSFDLGIAVRDDWPLLRSAMDKALASMSVEQHNEIYNRWVRLSVSQPFPWNKLLPLLFAALFLFLLLSVYLVRTQALNQRIQRVNASLAQAERELREKNRLLQEMSITDKLTGVFNRHHLDSVLSEEFDRSRRYGRDLSLVLFDLDHFKEINDVHGHQAGDEVLRRFAALVEELIRRSDVFGRWGGEEFLLICPECPADQAHEVAEKIRRAVSEHSYLQRYGLTISAGVMAIDGFESVAQLVSAADRQLYAAKAAGRNRVLGGQFAAPEG